VSIIGRKHLIEHFKHRRGKRKILDEKRFERYADRQRLLGFLGYSTYGEYLKTDEWKTIRSRVLATNPSCLMCSLPSQVVHHVKYWDTTLLGLDDRTLAALCHKCHELIEINEQGEKTALGQANHKLFKAIHKTPQGRQWFRDYVNRGRRRGDPTIRNYRQ
jgi:hypothetical protein